LCCLATATAELLLRAGWVGPLPETAVAPLACAAFNTAGVVPELTEAISAEGEALRLDSVSRLSRCKSERKSAAC
jgi:hypothetical protein